MTPLDVRCPRCNAQPGETCRSVEDYRRALTRLHQQRAGEVARVEAYQRERDADRATLRALTDGEWRTLRVMLHPDPRLVRIIERLALRLAATDDRRGEP